MEKIKIYQSDDSSFISDPKDYMFMIRERDYPELMMKRSSNYLNKKDYGEKVRFMMYVGRKIVRISLGYYGENFEHREDFVMEELTKKGIPFKLCHGPYGDWLEISRKYFELYYFPVNEK